MAISTIWSSITICTVWPIFGHQYSLIIYHNLSIWPLFGHQYSLVIYHNLYSLPYIWPSVQSGLLSQSVQSGLYLAISTVWSSIINCTVWPIFGHQYSDHLSQSVQSGLYLAINILIIYHNLYSLAYIWPSEQSGLLSQSIQSGLYLAISTVWSSITICTVCHIFGHQYSLSFYHNLYSLVFIWPSVQSDHLSQSVNLAYIWPSVQSGLLSQSVQSAIYLAISTVWSSIIICSVWPIFGHQ